MHPFTRFAAVVHLSALGFWAGVVAMTGAAAAVTFPTIKHMRPVIPQLRHDPDSHWLLVGGKAVSSIFEVSHLAQGTLALVVLASAIAVFAARSLPSALSRTIWLLTEAAALLTLGYYLFVVWPRMEKNLSDYWDFTYTDKPETAELAAASQAAFRADHPLSSFLLVTILVLLLIALLSAGWTLLSQKGRP